MKKTQDERHKTPDIKHKAKGFSLESGALSLESSLRILFIGDVIGRPGRTATGIILPELRQSYNPQLIIANGENLAGGLGITEGTADELFSYGVDLITTGNHVWDRKEILEYIDSDERILRPANYPQGVPGRGYAVLDVLPESSIQHRVAVFNLSGRVFMASLDDPFTAAANMVPKLREEANTVILDFHAEATSEKIAMGWYLDGRVSAVIGTHTHVQTADERILPNRTAYITDVGMTGPIDSVIGVKKHQIIQKFLTQMPVKFDVASGDVIVSCVILDVEPSTGRAKSIERLQKIVKQ